MALGNLIPHPLSHSDELFQYAAPFERFGIPSDLGFSALVEGGLYFAFFGPRMTSTSAIDDKLLVFCALTINSQRVAFLTLD